MRCSSREPGGTPSAERIRELVKDPALVLSPIAETLLFGAARAELLERVVRPALANGKVVICDRYIDSTVAYQGGARGLGIDRIERLNDWIAGGLWPDVTFLLDVPPAVAGGRGGEEDRFEQEGEELQRAVAAAYDELAERHAGRYVRIDASRPKAEVHEQVLAEVEARRAGSSAVSTVLAGTEDQPQARIALEGALRGGDLTHAYLFHGPPGTGKREAARAFAAALICEGASDRDDVERRVLDRRPSGPLLGRAAGRARRARRRRPHAGRAPGRASTIRGAAPRVRDRRGRSHERRGAERAAQDARGAGIVRAHRARELGAGKAPADDRLALQGVRFGPVPAARIAELLEAEGVEAGSALACARLAGGNARRARYLASPEGVEQRAEAEQAARATLSAVRGCAVGDRRAVAPAARPRLRRRAPRPRRRSSMSSTSASRTSRSAAGRGTCASSSCRRVAPGAARTRPRST